VLLNKEADRTLSHSLPCFSCTDTKFQAISPVLQTKLVNLVQEGKEVCK